MSEQPREQSSQERRGRPVYEPPRIEQSAEFETLALQCGRTTGPTCYYYGGYNS